MKYVIELLKNDLRINEIEVDFIKYLPSKHLVEYMKNVKQLKTAISILEKAENNTGT